VKCFVDFVPGKPNVLNKFNGRCKLELYFSILALNMDAHPWFFTREEIKTEAALSKND